MNDIKQHIKAEDKYFSDLDKYRSDITLGTTKVLPINDTGQSFEIKEAFRYNDGKLRYDLLEPYAIKELVKVFTAGAKKYSDNNWQKGMKWTKMIASLKRHLASFEESEDYDPETACHHLAHVAWNALGLVTYSKTHPELDDRNHQYLQAKRIGLDIDECIADFLTPYSKMSGSDAKPNHWAFCYNIVDNFTTWEDQMILDKFYLEDVKPLCDAHLPFEPVCYITNRPVDTWVTQFWLKKHKFPLKPVFTTKSREEKVAIAKEEKLDYFIDDNYETFVEMNKAGICCFLMDQAHNRKYNVGYKRIKDLNDFKERFL